MCIRDSFHSGGLLVPPEAVGGHHIGAVLRLLLLGQVAAFLQGVPIDRRYPTLRDGQLDVYKRQVFAFFLRVKKEGGPQARLEKTAFRYVRAKRTRCYKKRYQMRGHILLSPATKGCKNAVGGFAPKPPENGRFSF